MPSNFIPARSVLDCAAALVDNAHIHDDGQAFDAGHYEGYMAALVDLTSALLKQPLDTADQRQMVETVLLTMHQQAEARIANERASAEVADAEQSMLNRTNTL